VNSRVPTGLSYAARWPVRVYELDSYGHVNNAVYLTYAEEIATQHAEALGFGIEWAARQGGAWVVHRHEIIYHRPAGYRDELELTTRIESMRGARGIRRTAIRRVGDEALIAEISTEWVWVRREDGRPQRIPDAVLAAFLPTSGP
jgi:acyl-CoA thioester hydrolase